MVLEIGQVREEPRAARPAAAAAADVQPPAGLHTTQADYFPKRPPVPQEGCQYNYVVSAHKPTSVQHSAVGHFTAASDLNLVIS